MPTVSLWAQTSSTEVTRLSTLSFIPLQVRRILCLRRSPTAMLCNVEVLRYFLHNFIPVFAYRSAAVVCTEWHRTLYCDEFWKIACSRRWPYTTSLPLQNFYNFYRSHVFSHYNDMERLTQKAHFDEWLVDTYLLIEATVAGKPVSLALHFAEALRDKDAIGWQVPELASGTSDHVSYELPDIVLLTCHLWRASDERTCLMTMDHVMEKYDIDCEHYAMIPLEPPPFLTENNAHMMLQVHRVEYGANAHESFYNFGLRMEITYTDDNVHDDPHRLIGATSASPILNLHGWFSERYYQQRWPQPPASAEIGYWQPVALREIFHLTTCLHWH